MRNSKSIMSGKLKDSALIDRILSLTCPKDKDTVSEGVLDSLPNEILLKIFRNLDDLSLWVVSQVCKRWSELIQNEVNDTTWKEFVFKRWYLYKPNVKITNWKQIYTQLQVFFFSRASVTFKSVIFTILNVKSKKRGPSLFTIFLLIVVHL
jgi:hypothetical protein